MARQESVEDLEQGLIVREGHVGDPEVPLVTGVHEEGAGRRVHGGEVLGVGDLLQGQLADVIPVLHVYGLAQEGNGRLGA